jgi:hypothetical protein
MHTGGWNRTDPVNKPHNQGKVFSERLGIFFRAGRGRDFQVFSFRQDGKPSMLAWSRVGDFFFCLVCPAGIVFLPSINASITPHYSF